jgi:DNA mismatch repair protein MutL
VSDIIKLLPDSVANQIAAGEVVQRPASAVKELLENSLDAGATHIKLIIKDGGSTLIQVIDNGGGMSETDARMCWERHATSKINTALDIYALRTFGFRGEALASIAAVAQVEMKTRRNNDDAATLIRIEASKVLEQNIISAPYGTSISVKNLFYNIPARRNFLKSASVETRHIIEEFQRQALAHPDIYFQLYNNQNNTFDLKPADNETRIKEVLGISKPLLEVNEETEIVGIHGFIGLPETARKSKGDQYFFVNGRFIRSAYFNHAIQSAYVGLLEDNAYPLFVLNLSIDPSKVDVNVHPTKTEVKFEDDRHIYNIIKAAVRKTLGNHIVQPDAELFGLGGIEAFLKQDLPISKNEMQQGNYNTENHSLRPAYDPFKANSPNPYQKKQDWSKVFGHTDTETEGYNREVETSKELNLGIADKVPEITEVFQLGNQFIVAKIQEELFVLDPHLAHEKILFAHFKKYLQNQSGSCQQLLFPRTINLNPSKLNLLLELMDDFKSMGFDMSHFGGNTIIINGLPPELNRADENKILEKMLEDYENTQGELKLAKHDSLALSLARQTAIPRGVRIEPEMQKFLVEGVFASRENEFTFDNRAVMIKIGTELLYDIFRKQKKI